jgi:hypothetical protein
MHFDPDKKLWVKVDSFDYVSGSVLSQLNDNRVFRPVAFFSKKLLPQECNYGIYDKELLAIVRVFEKWKPELASTDFAHPVNVFSDHKALEYFMITKELNARQARWEEFLSQFHFTIRYRLGI